MLAQGKSFRALQTLIAALILAKEAGIDVNKETWLKYQANQTQDLSDAELEGVAGGAQTPCRAPRII